MSKKNVILTAVVGLVVIIGGWLMWSSRQTGAETGVTGLDPETAAIIEDRSGGTVVAEPDDPNPPPRGSGKQPK